MIRSLFKIVILLLLSVFLSCNDEKLEIGKVEVWDLAANLHNEEVKFYFLGLQSLGNEYEIYLSEHLSGKKTEIELESIDGYDIKFITLKSLQLMMNTLKVDIQKNNVITINKNFGLEFSTISFNEIDSKIDVKIIFRNSEPNLYMIGDKYKLNKTEPKN